MKRVAIAAAAVLTVVGLSACGDSRPCLRGHYDTILMPIRVGKTTTMIPEQVFVCDKREAVAK